MVNAFIRRLVVALSLLALVGTGIASPVASAQPDKAMASHAMTDDGSMPCCPHKAPSCVTDVGCVFLIGIPAPSGHGSATLLWSTLTYTVSHSVGEGLSLQPALGPPILPA
jgi:hypothetical protein